MLSIALSRYQQNLDVSNITLNSPCTTTKHFECYHGSKTIKYAWGNKTNTQSEEFPALSKLCVCYTPEIFKVFLNYIIETMLTQS